MKIELFDTTLRDGTQAEGVNLTVHDKITIALKLDDFGINYIEGGWPGSNPKDKEFFNQIKKHKLKNAQICAFGSTARDVNNVEGDVNLNALIQAETPVISIFGKTWDLHSKNALNLTDEQNAELIYKSIKYLKSFGRQVIFDAEHFFDGYKANSDFAIKMLIAAKDAGADLIALCDTNGGSLPDEVYNIVSNVKQKVDIPLGIHAHNDSECAVANSLQAIKAGAVHVQGTINGLGERCGNANLCSIIPALKYKLNYDFHSNLKIEHLTELSHFIDEIINLPHNTRLPYVGMSAFAHKGGIHVSAVLKDSRMYEHMDPKLIGNKQRVPVSDLSGQSNIKYKAAELGIVLEDSKVSKKVVQYIKDLEAEGYQFEGAEASFELLLRNELGEYKPFFNVPYYKLVVSGNGEQFAEAVLKVEVNGEIEHTAANGVGPVNALDNALRKALSRFFPSIKKMKLIDYKVRVLDEKKATEAKVRVMITSKDDKNEWGTVGVSENIIEASFKALMDSLNYKLFKDKLNKKTNNKKTK
ncbi:MAG TPA: citramalate synthase [Ignavibacteriales bacterium]|nr:citramalate synthase [Ignavibacteriales bacterium]